MTLDPTRALFFEEAADLLRDFEEALLRLEQAPGDPEVLNRIFRSAHTLKGNSAMLRFEAIAQFTHVLEGLLSRLRAGSVTATQPVVDVLLASADVLRSLIQRAQDDDTREVEGLASTVEALRALSSAGVAKPTPASPTRPRPARDEATLYRIDFRPMADLLRRGLDPVRILDGLEELGEVARLDPEGSALPPLGEMDPEAAYLGFTCWLRSREPQSRIEACFEFADEDLSVRPEPGLEVTAPPTEPAAAAALAGRGLPRGAAKPPGASVENPSAGLVERRSGRDRRSADGERWTEATTIRVATEKVDRLVNLVGELVITQSILTQLVSRFTPARLGQLEEAVAQMDRHARDLQERVMAIRMLPIRTVFSRIPRMLRDLAQARGKEAVVEALGEETELDKSVIEQISDPLTHLVRNAVDHGIERPEVRRERGKPAAGRLTLRAYQQGGSIHIEVADDGGGLDRHRILAKAVEVGLVQGGESLSDEEVYALIFHPGFSTAEIVTEVSGRGVGMDVVRRNVEALGGSITIRTEPGRGTTFDVKLPLTLAILDGQSLRVGDETYIMPLVSIVESVRPSGPDLNTVFGTVEGILIRGQVVPMLRLHRLFGVRPGSEDPTEGLVVVVEHDGRKVALLVDELLGQQQVVIKSLERNFQKLEGVAGATILGNGRVALILDVPGLVALGRTAGVRPARREAAAPA